MIDSHCHLADPTFADDLEAVVQRAVDSGVTHALVILAAGDAAETGQAARLQTLWPGARFSAGVHPHQAHEYAADGSAPDTVRRAFETDPLTRAVGEIGLDYHYDFSPRDVQLRVFAEQVALARELHKRVIVHTREAVDDTFDVLRSEGRGEITGVFHCFTGDAALARRALDLGFSLSFAGIVTFPKAADVREAAAIVPDDRLLVETDSPFLAPVPHRGKRNEPAYVGRVIETLASIRGVSAAEIDAITTHNFLRFVGDH